MWVLCCSSLETANVRFRSRPVISAGSGFPIRTLSSFCRQKASQTLRLSAGIHHKVISSVNILNHAASLSLGPNTSLLHLRPLDSSHNFKPGLFPFCRDCLSVSQSLRLGLGCHLHGLPSSGSSESKSCSFGSSGAMPKPTSQSSNGRNSSPSP